MLLVSLWWNQATVKTKKILYNYERQYKIIRKREKKNKMLDESKKFL